MTLKWIETTERRIVRTVNSTLIFLFVAMLGLASIQVALRIFFNTGILWMDPLARRLVLWTGLLGAVLASSENKHFHLDVVTRFFPPRIRIFLAKASNLFLCIVCGALFYASLTFLTIGLDEPDQALFNLPSYFIGLILPVTFLLMTILYGIRLVKTPAISPSSTLPTEETVQP